MATCPNGHENPKGQHFCGECGVVLTKPKPPATTKAHRLEVGDSVRVVAPGDEHHGKIGQVDQISVDGKVWMRFGHFWNLRTYNFRRDQLQQQPVKKRQMGPWIIAGAVLLAAGSCAALVVAGQNHPSDHTYTPPPGVSEIDAAFLKAMHGHGITNDNGDMAMISLAHGICGELRSGQSVDGVAEHWGLTSERISTDSARFYVRTAAAAYCPQYLR